MTKTFNLSEKIDELVINPRKPKEEFIHVTKVKEFIRLLKEKFTNKWTLSLEIDIKKKINKLAGDKLI